MSRQIEEQEEVLHEEESEDMFFQEIDALQNEGINAADISKLKVAGVCTVRGVQMMTRRNLAKIKGMSEAKIEKILEAAKKICDCGFITAAECSIRRQSIFYISTGSKELDKLVGGGIQSMSITEVFGEFRTGKTQMSHTLCITAQLPVEMGGAGGKAAYIDTEGNFSSDDWLKLGTFRPDRIKAIAERFGLDQDEAAENVIYARAYNSEHQMDLITYLAARFAEEKGVYRVLIVDSIIALFRADFCGRGELSERQQKLNQMLSRLMKIAEVRSDVVSCLSEEFNLAVFITNQMSSDPGAGISFVADPKKPVGGHILAHASTTRLSLRKGRGENRVAKIYDSPDVPEAEAVYAIGGGGIVDSTE